MAIKRSSHNNSTNSTAKTQPTMLNQWSMGNYLTILNSFHLALRRVHVFDKGVPAQFFFFYSRFNFSRTSTRRDKMLKRVILSLHRRASNVSKRYLSRTTNQPPETSKSHTDITKPPINNHNTFASLWKESWKDAEPDVVIAHGKRGTETQSWLQLFHEPLTRVREVNWSLPWSIGQIYIPFTLSNVAGHGSFLFLMASYLETDFLNLRMYALSGISLSLIFQYYREKPLWIPLQWNFLFLLINAVMISFLLKESNDAEDMMKNEEQKHLYDSTFKIYGMKPVDFLHLMSIAQRREVNVGEKIVEQGKHHNRLHLVQV